MPSRVGTHRTRSAKERSESSCHSETSRWSHSRSDSLEGCVLAYEVVHGGHICERTRGVTGPIGPPVAEHGPEMRRDRMDTANGLVHNDRHAQTSALPAQEGGPRYPALSALTAPEPPPRPRGNRTPRRPGHAAPGCGAGRAEGPVPAPRPAGVSGGRPHVPPACGPPPFRGPVSASRVSASRSPWPAPAARPGPGRGRWSPRTPASAAAGSPGSAGPPPGPRRRQREARRGRVHLRPRADHHQVRAAAAQPVQDRLQRLAALALGDDRRSPGRCCPPWPAGRAAGPAPEYGRAGM